MGAPGEDSASTGTFAPGDVGYQTVLNNSDSTNSGAVSVYRRSDSEWSLEAFVKAPVAGVEDRFGSALALSDSGSVLAVGAPNEDSASTGTFAPGDAGYQTALDSEASTGSGAVTVYRRSGSAWSLEAFVKAPGAGGGDRFGSALALDSGGVALAVGAPGEDSASTGTFAPGDAGYQTALDSEASTGSGAVTVYRRSESNDWEIEAFVKAPNADAFDEFGFAVALSDGTATLAVGAPFEESASTGTFAPSDAGYQAALDDDSVHSVLRYNLDHASDPNSEEFLETEVGIDAGAAYVYRRSGADGLWTVEAFVKAPGAGGGDRFGSALALSGDGDTLAVGAPLEGSSHTGTFAPGGTGYQAALDSDGADASGAVTAYPPLGRQGLGDRGLRQGAQGRRRRRVRLRRRAVRRRRRVGGGRAFRGKRIHRRVRLGRHGLPSRAGQRRRPPQRQRHRLPPLRRRRPLDPRSLCQGAQGRRRRQFRRGSRAVRRRRRAGGGRVPRGRRRAATACRRRLRRRRERRGAFRRSLPVLSRPWLRFPVGAPLGRPAHGPRAQGKGVRATHQPRARRFRE